MTTCASCGRAIPCGCPNPVRADAALTSLFGVVCDRCDGYNDPGQASCLLCGQQLDAAAEPRTEIGPPELTPVAASAFAGMEALPEFDPHRTPVPGEPPAEPRALNRPAATTRRPSKITEAPTLRVPNPIESTPVTAPPTGEYPPPAALPLQLGAPTTPHQDPLPLTASAVLASPPQALVLTQVMAEGNVCDRCGAHNPPEFRFCTDCGMALKPLESTAAKTPTLPLTVGKAAARVLRGDKLGQTLGIGMQATAGRSQGRLSFPGDPFLAAHHCTLHFQQNRFFVRDEGSPSGTFVRLRDEEPLAAGDVFAIGDHLLRYVGPLTAEMTAADGTRILGCPRPPGSAVQIEEIHEGGVPGLNHVRLGPSLIIGRDDGCDLSFSGDPFVSGRHCNITIGASGRARIRDLGSTNGTFRRLEPGSERELLKGDCVRIGSEVLQMVESAAPVL